MADVATATASPSGSFAAFLALSKDERKEIIKRTHALYSAKAASWQVFLDAYEGSGGFEDGEYLWKYPREESTEYTTRQAQARYHNYAKSLVNLYVRHVFHSGVKRVSEDQGLMDFWADVDGAGTKIDDFMKRAAHLALAMGHDGVLVDKTTEPAAGPSRADERSRVFASLYTPLNIKDWRIKRDELVTLKLEEAVETDDLLAKEPAGDDEACRYLVWSKTDGWMRVDEKGELVTTVMGGFDNPHLDLIPFAVLRPEASAANPFLGQSLLGNANVFKALFNRCSEEDEVLRASSFSMLAVSVPEAGDVEEVKKQVGTEVGTMRAIIAKGEIDYKTPDQSVPESLRKAIEYLVQEIYRMAHVTFHRDSRDAESAEALRLKHSELNEMLAGLAAALTSVEQLIAKFYFAWSHPTAVAAEGAMTAAKVSITYPREFFVSDLVEELTVWAEAIALDLGLTFTQRIKLRAARTLEPDMDEATLKKVEEEIKAQPPPPPPPDPNVLRQRAGGVLNPPKPGDPPQPKPIAA